MVEYADSAGPYLVEEGPVIAREGVGRPVHPSGDLEGLTSAGGERIFGEGLDGAFYRRIVQAIGWVDELPWFFRAHGGTWTFRVAPDPFVNPVDVWWGTEGWIVGGVYEKEMLRVTAARIIKHSVNAMREMWSPPDPTPTWIAMKARILNVPADKLWHAFFQKSLNHQQ